MSTETVSTKRKLRTRMIGKVVSDKVNKTRRVVVDYLAPHAKYGKYVKRQTVLHVHDEANVSQTGDTVEVMSCRPISKTKTYRFVRIVTKGPGAIDTSAIESDASKLFAKNQDKTASA
ncbi:MAG: 30S ribosomal protein S17 [Phycisphaerae bacterium]|jgi:small subunit ribosomal protein S17